MPWLEFYVRKNRIFLKADDFIIEVVRASLGTAGPNDGGVSGLSLLQPHPELPDLQLSCTLLQRLERHLVFLW